MSENKQRVKENFWQIVETFTGRQGRKVAFGVWGFWIATTLLRVDKITSQIWWWSFLTCALLIGFGTILDDILEKMGEKISGMLADKVNRFTEKTTIEATTEVTAPAAAQ